MNSITFNNFNTTHSEPMARVPYIRDICMISAFNGVSTPLSRHILVLMIFFRALCLILGVCFCGKLLNGSCFI